MTFIFHEGNDKPAPGVEVLGLVHSKSVRFGTEHMDVDICYVDDKGEWHTRLAGEFKSNRYLLSVERWTDIPNEFRS